MNRGFAVVATVFFLAACGGDGSGTSSPNEWADALCSDLSTWTDSITSATSSLRGGNLSQEGVQDAVNEVTDTTETLVGELQDLGRPDTEAGQEAEDEIDQLADQLQTGIGELERAAAGVSSPADAAQAASSINATLTSMGNQLSSSVQSLEQVDAQGELKSAFEESESCRELTRS